MRIKTVLISFLFLMLTGFSVIAEASIPTPTSLTPNPMNCPDSSVGSTVLCGDLTFYNGAGRPVTVTSIFVGNHTDFTVNIYNCNNWTLGVGQSCTMPVRFHPSGKGSFGTGVTIFYKDNKNRRFSIAAEVYGNSTRPVVSLTPDSVDFGDQIVNTSSWRYVKMENIGDAALNIYSITAPSDSPFSVQSDCGDSLDASESCTLQIYFEPTAETPYISDVTISDDAEDSPQLVEVSGTGIATGRPDVNLSTTAINFGNKLVGSTNTETVTVTNGGDAVLIITSIVASGISPYSQSNTCLATLDPAASCTITVTFAPITASSFSGTITLNDDASDTPQTVTLDGKGVSPNATLAPSLIEFGNQTIDKSSSAHEVVLLNSGTSDLTITDISTTSSIFTQTNNCSATLGPKKSCTIYVTFTPTAEGDVGGTLNVYDDDPDGSPQFVWLFGKGITGPDVDIVPSLHDFGDVAVGETSAPQEFWVTNTGEGTLNIYGISVNSAFEETNDCTETLDEGESCLVEGAFAPTSGGNYFGVLSITDDATGSPQKANLWGYGTSASITLLPTSINFGGQTVNKSSLAHDLRILNTGNDVITITSIDTGSTIFTLTNGCDATLAPAAYCTVSVTFTPTSTGETTGAVTITDSVSGSPQIVALTGEGIDPVYPDLDISPNFKDFGYVLVGQTSAEQTFTLKNTGVADVVISAIDANSEFTLAGDAACETTLTEGQICTFTGAFAPHAAGTFTGFIKVVDNTPTHYQTASLKGVATHSGDINIDISTTELNFGDITVNTSSDPRSIIVSNSGTDDLMLGAIQIGGTDAGNFSRNTNCQDRTLDVGKSCLINVQFNPHTAGAQKAHVEIFDDASGSPQIVIIDGTGTEVSGSGGCSLIAD